MIKESYYYYYYYCSRQYDAVDCHVLRFQFGACVQTLHRTSAEPDMERSHIL